MSTYTTGELAKLCGVSVRTVQYYHNRRILCPSALSEGGRRLYSEEDLEKLQIICFLREMDFALEDIGRLLSQEQPEKVISLLVEQQEAELRQELRERSERLNKLTQLKRGLKNVESFTLASLGDIAYLMKTQKKRRRMLFAMTALGLVMDGIQIGMLLYGIRTGNWLPLAWGIPTVIALGVFISWYYFRHVDYICPHCHSRFHPRFWVALWAGHTPNTRRLTCPDCGKKSYCVETYREVKNAEN